MFKRMKRLLRLRSKSGFTLVEMIIACALLGILVLGMLGFMTPILSSLRVKEQNARARMLSEAIDSYIANSVQYAFYVQTIDTAAGVDTVASGGAQPDVLSLKYAGSDFEKQKDKGLSDLVNCLNTDLSGGVYEIRCIGIRWMDVPGGDGTKKLMLTNEKVDQATCALDPTASEPVFESVFYDGLYPIVKFENYSNQYQLKDEDGNPQDQVKEEDVDIAPSIKVITDVYLTPDCYSTDENVRKNAILAVSGMTYADFSNIRSKLINKENTYKIHPTLSAHTTISAGKTVPHYAGAYAADPAGTSYVVDGKNYYYPNSFIYYIARKTRLATPSSSTPASSSVPSSSSTS